MPRRRLAVPRLAAALAARLLALLALAALLTSACRPGEERNGTPTPGEIADAGHDPGPRRSAGDRDEPEPGAHDDPDRPDTTGLSVPGADTLPASSPGADSLRALAAGAPSIGPADAAVTIIEFSDFECPFCGRAKDTIHRLMQDRPDARLVYLQFPILSLHPGAMLPAEASLEAHRQGKFWPFHDALFDHGPPLDRVTLLEIARQQGLDVAAMRRALDRRTHRARVEREMRFGEALGINGTPTFFFNGYRMVGALPYETFVTVYNLLLRASRRELAEAGPAR